jgi:alpha-tubulin suppressor-like RCC1 family protein
MGTLVVGCGENTAPGAAWTWGFSLVPFARPINMPSGVAFAAVVMGKAYDSGGYAVALDQSGQAWAWGASSEGALGNASILATPDPVVVSMPSGVTFTAIATGDAHCIALDRGGHVWTWGRNHEGQLGTGTTANSLTPVAVRMPPGVRVTGIAAGLYTSFALDQLGRVWSWGFNGAGELGDGAFGLPANSSTPVAVSMPQGVSFTAIAAGGGNGMALDRSGHAWAWGDDSGGELGNGITGGAGPCKRRTGSACSPVPVAVSMPPGVTFVALAVGESTLALDRSGHAWAWGRNLDGQLGIATNMGPQACPGAEGGCSTTPVAVQMPAGVRFTAIATSGRHDVALDSRGQLWAWGLDTNLELGARDGVCHGTQPRDSFLCSTTPLRMAMPPGVTFAAIAATDGFSVALSGATPRTG